MDVLWVVLDSLSYSVTPFGSDSPETMPRLEALAKECGITFTNAYVPGPSSPSSHSAFFTGQRPSVAGMHEAHPYYDGTYPTIAGALSETHESLLISANPYLCNGLEQEFDEVNDLRRQQYLLFESATDPETFLEQTEVDSTLRQYVHFCLEGGKPLRSLLNAIQYKLWSRRQNASIPASSAVDELSYQYAEEMNPEIRRFRSAHNDALVVANYMDVHPPLDASQAALDNIAPETSKADLPVGVPGQKVYERIQAGDKAIGDAMYTLLQATVWDVDRKVTPLVREAVEDGAFVVVTADHGIWFRRTHDLDEERLHVPLILFHPEEPARTVNATVNIRALPATTTSAIDESGNVFDGTSLFEVTNDQVSITEFIHEANSTSKPVSPRGAQTGQIQYDVAAIEGRTRVDFVDGTYRTLRGDGEVAESLRTVIEDVRTESPNLGPHGDIEYNEDVKQRLEDFGYL